MTAPQDDSAGSDLQITVLRGDPTPEELAAVTAVIGGIAQELSDDALEARSGAVRRSAWDLSRIAVRQPLAPGPGAWERAVR